MHAHGESPSRSSAIVLLGLLCGWCSPALAVDEDDGYLEDKRLLLYVAEQVSYTNNLFHLSPTEVIPPEFSEQGAARHDSISRTTAGMRWNWKAGRQEAHANVRVSDVRFQNSDYLDHVAHEGDIEWKWALGSKLSGKLGLGHERALASFTNYQYFDKDLVDADSYDGELQLHLNPSWSLIGTADFARVRHDADDRESSNFNGESAGVALAYTAPTLNRIALELQSTATEFPDAEVAGEKPSFDETVTRLHITYLFSVKTTLDLSLGRLERDGNDAYGTDYSGTVANLAFDWRPREQYGFQITGWRDLRAYIDDQTDYFVSQGVGVGPLWEPTRHLTIRLRLAYEKQDYIGDNVTRTSDPRRQDIVRSARLALSYQPWRNLLFNLRWTEETRDSNRDRPSVNLSGGGLEARILF